MSAAGIEVDVLPTSFAQARLWFLDRLNPGNTAYVSHVSLRLRGPLDVDSLDPAIRAVVDRHESLRTRFVGVDGEPVQVVEPLGRARLECVDLSDETDPLAAARTLASSVARTSFDLERGPLLRCVVARLGVDDWALVLALHHIVVDGWSLGVLLSDLVRAYRACSDGRAPSWPPLPLQYGDYAIWQRERFDGTRLEAEIAWWRERLRDAPSVALPTDRPRPALPSHRGGRERVVIDAAVTASLRELAQAEGASFFMCLLASYALLLARCCDQRDLVIGTPVAGRSRPELEPLVGFFVNTLALRVKLDGAPTFRQLLRHVRHVALDAYDHQELPFERLVAALSPERHLDRNPLFQTTFALQPAGASRLQLPGVRIEPLGATSDTVKFDLALTCVEAGDKLVASLAYASDLFDADTAAGLVRRLATLAAGIAADPDAPIETLPLLSPAERAALADGGRRAVARPGLCVHELVARQAAGTPTAPAVESESGTLTYEELLARAEDLAGHLALLGAAAGTVVAILLQPSRELVVAELGVLQAGAAFLPLDPSTPPGRLAAVLERAAPVTVLTTPELAARLPAGTPLVRLDAPLPPGRAVAGRVTPSDLAYLVATSGTTGVPKLAAVEHRSLANHLLWISEEVLPDPDVRLPCLSSPAFDASLKQLLGPLVRGGAAWIAPVEARSDPGATLRALAARRRTALNCVPPLWEAMLDLVESGAAPRPTSLECLLLGGMDLPERLLRRTFSAFGELAVWNLYGPTEATVNALAARLLPGDEVTIGRPVPNVEAHVLDGRGAPQAPGVPGELVLGGLALARGYYGDDAATRVAFPQGGESSGERRYRTGDRVVRRSDGRIRYLGRFDDQVKIRGLRVELEEIAMRLRGHPGVLDAVVVLRDGAPAAFVVPATGLPPSVPELRAELAAHLPEGTLPTSYTFLDELPLTAAGKPDRAALRVPARPPVRSAAAPRTPTEREVAALWQELLGGGRIGRDDSFFELGGHSLLLVRAHARLAERAPGLAVVDLFRAPTVRTLAARVDALAAVASPGTAP